MVKFPDTRIRLGAGVAALLALAIMPAPLLPPHRIAELMQAVLHVDWKIAYLFAAILLQSLFYASIGVLAAFAAGRANSPHKRVLQLVLLPLIVIFVALCIRSFKAGHLPVWVNAAVPVVACVVGVILGSGYLHRHWKMSLSIVVLVIGCVLWGFLYQRPTTISKATEDCLRQLVAAGPYLPQGNARFVALLQTAFRSTPADSNREDAILHNRAAIVAWGISLGHPHLARFVGLDPQGELVSRAFSLHEGTTLRDRHDWTQHYALSAGLAALENPLVSDAAGLMKEQLDALTEGSGFSFGDLVADRAGVRLANAATKSEAAAKAMQLRLQDRPDVDDLFPPVVDFSENLSTEEFRRLFGGVGTPRYHREVIKIEAELDRCAALTPSLQSPQDPDMH